MGIIKHLLNYDNNMYVLTVIFVKKIYWFLGERVRYGIMYDFVVVARIRMELKWLKRDENDIKAILNIHACKHKYRTEFILSMYNNLYIY